MTCQTNDAAQDCHVQPLRDLDHSYLLNFFHYFSYDIKICMKKFIFLTITYEQLIMIVITNNYYKLNQLQE